MTRWNPYASETTGDTPRWLWIASGVYGGLAAGLSASWLLWGGPRLLTASLCFLVKILVVGLLALLACAGGCGLVMTLRTLVKALRQIFSPPSLYEPVDPIPEMEILSWPHPGCGLVILLPIIGVGAIVSLPWFYFGLVGPPIGYALLMAALGVPFGLYMAYVEAKAGRLK